MLHFLYKIQHFRDIHQPKTEKLTFSVQNFLCNFKTFGAISAYEEIHRKVAFSVQFYRAISSTEQGIQQKSGIFCTKTSISTGTTRKTQKSGIFCTLETFCIRFFHRKRIFSVEKHSFCNSLQKTMYFINL